MLYREIIVVCSEIHTKHINTLCGQNVELLNVKPGYKHSNLLLRPLLLPLFLQHYSPLSLACPSLMTPNSALLEALVLHLFTIISPFLKSNLTPSTLI